MTAPTIRTGLQLWSQSTDWPAFRDAALAAEASGWDSVWTWDHLPIHIGGSGRRKTLRTVAQRADGWNTAGELADATDALAALEGHAADFGRDLGSLERTISVPIVIRDDAAAARARMDELCAANGVTTMGDVPHLAGSPETIAEDLRPYVELGFTTVIVRMPAPYDHETIDRMGEVTALLSS